MKKKYALALGGGVAKGFSYIGVLQYLEEEKIEINEIAWTSMGAIIWAMFAMGKTSEEIYDATKGFTFLNAFDFELKWGLKKWKKINKKLEEVFWEANIEETKIPLKIIATNLETGEKNIFTSWKILDAIRATISIPISPYPYKIWKNHYIDGGVINNLPIEALEWKDIIALSVAQKIIGPIPKKKKKKFSLNPFAIDFQILQRAILLMMVQNEEISLATVWKNIFLLRPDFWKLGFFDFHKVKEFVEIGYESMKKKVQEDKIFFSKE